MFCGSSWSTTSGADACGGSILSLGFEGAGVLNVLCSAPGVPHRPESCIASARITAAECSINLLLLLLVPPLLLQKLPLLLNQGQGRGLLSLPKDTRLTKLSPNFAPDPPPDPSRPTAGETVLEDSSDGLKASLAKALAGGWWRSCCLRLDLKASSLYLELLSMDGNMIAFGGIREFGV